METARGVAEKIAACDPDVIRGIKQAVVRGMDLPLAQGLDLEKTLACQRGPENISKNELIKKS
jgi:enoyl-CoA hydratase/carnithine racemase